MATLNGLLVRVGVQPGVRLFYGWYIVLVGFLVNAMLTGVGVYTLGLFIRPMTTDLGWSRTAFSGLQTFQTATSGVLSPIVGPIIDRRGSRELIMIGAFIAGLAFVLQAVVSELWHFYLLRGVLFSIGMVLGGSMVANVAVSSWFVRRRGRALAISAMGVSAAGIVAPQVVGRIIDSFDWRTASMVLGILMWVVIIPTAAIFMKRRPEDIGLQPDGDSPDDGSTAGAQVSTRRQSAGQLEALASRDVVWTRWQAVRTLTLWQIVFAYSLGSLGMTAVLLHLVPYLMDQGYSIGVAATAVSVQNFGGLVAKPVWGLFIERVPARFASALQFVISAAGIAAVFFASNLALIYAALFLLGCGIGGILIVQDSIWANYFGRRSLGAVRTVGVPVSLAASATGPLFAGYIYDATGGYGLAFSVFVCTWVAAAALILTARVPKQPVAAPATA